MAAQRKLNNYFHIQLLVHSIFLVFRITMELRILYFSFQHVLVTLIL